MFDQMPNNNVMANTIDNEMTSNIYGNNNTVEQEVNMNVTASPMAMPMQGGCNMQPIVEPMRERQVHRTIMHEVPHVCPMRTRVINHHIYKHTYRPDYSCCEENVVSNMQCGSCCDFK